MLWEYFTAEEAKRVFELSKETDLKKNNSNRDYLLLKRCLTSMQHAVNIQKTSCEIPFILTDNVISILTKKYHYNVQINKSSSIATIWFEL